MIQPKKVSFSVTILETVPECGMWNLRGVCVKLHSRCYQLVSTAMYVCRADGIIDGDLMGF